MVDVDKVLSNLSFEEARFIQNRSSIADLFKPKRRCGIYVLHFASGEFYVGQAIDVTRRYIQHRKNHTDITKISFKCVPAQSLNEIERATIATLEQSRYLLRNISLTSVPRGDSDFDLIMPTKVQERWLSDLTFSEPKGLRPIDPDLRRKYRRRYERFCAKPFANDVIEILHRYANVGIPAIRRSEISFWSCSCLPAFRSTEMTIYSRINIYWQEVLTVGTENNVLWASWHLALSPLQKAFGKNLAGLARRHKKVDVDEHRYTPGGADQISLLAEGKSVILALMEDADVLSAIRLFNLCLMKKGACAYNRYHCLDLADHLVE